MEYLRATQLAKATVAAEAAVREQEGRALALVKKAEGDALVQVKLAEAEAEARRQRADAELYAGACEMLPAMSGEVERAVLG